MKSIDETFTVLECPFCGSVNIAVRRSNSLLIRAWVRCRKCKWVRGWVPIDQWNNSQFRMGTRVEEESPDHNECP